MDLDATATRFAAGFQNPGVLGAREAELLLADQAAQLVEDLLYLGQELRVGEVFKPALEWSVPAGLAEIERGRLLKVGLVLLLCYLVKRRDSELRSL